MRFPKQIWASFFAASVVVVAPGAGLADQARPAGPVELKLNWSPGRHALESIDVRENSAITVPWTSQPITQKMALGLEGSLDVSTNSTTSQRDLEMRYTGFQLNLGINDAPLISYDSTSASPDDANPLATFLKKMIGTKVSFMLTPDNQVESVQGLDGPALATNIPAASSGRATMVPTKSILSPDLVKQAIDFTKYLPAKSVKPGDSWPVHEDFPMGKTGAVVLDINCTLATWEKHGGHWCAKVIMRGTFNSKPGANPEIPGMMGATMDFRDGVCSGGYLFDLETGMLTDHVLKLDTTADINVPNPLAKVLNSPAEVTAQDALHEAVITKIRVPPDPGPPRSALK